MTDGVVEITVVNSTIEQEAILSTLETTSIASTIDETVVSSTFETTTVATTVEETPVYTLVVGEQGPPGVSGEGSGANFQTTNRSGTTIQKGQPVASHSSGVGVVLANATDNTRPGIGLMVATVADLAACTVQTSGPFTLDDWTAVIGSEFLAAKAVYYLDVVDGMLTVSSPSASPNISHRIGKAVSPTILDIDIWQFVRL